MKIIKSASYKKAQFGPGWDDRSPETDIREVGDVDKMRQRGKALTFEEWMKTKSNIQPHLAEDGYAFYLKKEVLGRNPTMDEMKSIGKINRFLSDPI